MNEPKTEDVMKDLECCIKTQCENCCNLGSWHEQWNCMTDLMKKALFVMHDQNARIAMMAQCIERQDKELEKKDEKIKFLEAQSSVLVKLKERRRPGRFIK